MVHTLAWRQYDEGPNVIPFSQVIAAKVSIFDDIRELSTLRPPLEGLLLK